MKGAVIWIAGLPASGKSTLAAHVAGRLRALDVPVLLLDGDAVRATLHPPPGFDDASRDAFYRTLAGLAALAAGQGLVAIVAATSNRREHRTGARRLWPGLVEVLVDVPVAECERRDPKGLYAKARRGEAPALPGLGVPFESPEAPEVVARGGEDEVAREEIVRRVLERRGG